MGLGDTMGSNDYGHLRVRRRKHDVPYSIKTGKELRKIFNDNQIAHDDFNRRLSNIRRKGR